MWSLLGMPKMSRATLIVAVLLALGGCATCTKEKFRTNPVQCAFIGTTSDNGGKF
jgi:hypothetical protein